MAYIFGDDILAAHYNLGADTINAIWGVGAGDSGYGQVSTLPTVSIGVEDVTATQWATLLDRMDSIEAHQGSSITNPANPTVGQTISVFADIEGDLTTLTDSRLDHVANGADGSNTIVASSTWTDNTTHTCRFTWSSAAHARYFFNAGGEIRISFARTGGTAHTKNTEWTALATACGTLVFGARSFAKVGGSGTPTTENDNGWYDITSSFVQNFKQFEATAPYTANYIGVETRTASAASQFEIRVTYKDDATDDNPADTVDGTVTTTFVERPPSTSNLADTWGNPSFTTLTNTQT
jgi:hypothetical protein